MSETFFERKIDDLKPNMSTLEKLDFLDITPNQTVVTAKVDGEFTLLVYDRDGESYTLNKWNHRRTNFPALNQLVEAMKKTQLTHVEFLAELYAVIDNRPAKLPQFIHVIKGEHDFNKIHIGVWDLLSIDGATTQQSNDWKMQEVEGWLSGCSHVAVVPHILPKTLQDVKDFWNVYVEGKGYEGLVIRNGKQVSKIKPTLEVDAVIIGLNKKTSYGKDLDLFQQGQITSIKLALLQEDGTFLELSDCASGITADLRTVLWKLMEFKVAEDDKTVSIRPVAICTVQYTDTFPRRREVLKFVEGEGYKFRGYTQFISLREPRLIRFRPDKTVNPQDLRLTQIPETKMPKEEPKPQPQQISKTTSPPIRDENMSQPEAPRIVKPTIIVKSNDSLVAVLDELRRHGWKGDFTFVAETLEEAVDRQTRLVPSIEFQPVQRPDGKWEAVSRITVEEWLKNQEQKPTVIAAEEPKEEPFRYKVSPELKQLVEKSEGFDAYWKRNNTCVDYLTSLILKKMTPEMLRKMTHGCGGDNAIEGVNQQFQDECWSKLEHPEWFGQYGSPYYIKPYLALCVKLDLDVEAYRFLNEGTAFPHYFEPRVEEKPAEETEKFRQYDDRLFNKTEAETPAEANDDDLPCGKDSFKEEDCKTCLDPCTDKCSFGVPLTEACENDACQMCERRVLKGEDVVCLDLEDNQTEEPEKEQPKTQKQTTLF